MIRIDNLAEIDKGRAVTYHREHCKREYGVLSSWNSEYVFVRFKGPNGEACYPEDVSFDLDVDGPAAQPAERDEDG